MPPHRRCQRPPPRRGERPGTLHRLQSSADVGSAIQRMHVRRDREPAVAACAREYRQRQRAASPAPATAATALQAGWSCRSHWRPRSPAAPAAASTRDVRVVAEIGERQPLDPQASRRIRHPQTREPSAKRVWESGVNIVEAAYRLVPSALLSAGPAIMREVSAPTPTRPRMTRGQGPDAVGLMQRVVMGNA